MFTQILLNMIDLSGKKILITGASSGIGRQVAIACSANGARTIISGRSLSGLKETAQLMSSQPEIITCDLSVESEIEQLAKSIDNLDGMAHCAGVIQPFAIKFIKSKHILELLQINLFSGILLCSSFLRNKVLNHGASIVFISSVSAHHPYTGGALYSVSKAGLESFSKSFALENADKMMRSNVVSPALVQTKIFDDTKEAFDEAELKRLVNQYPLGIGEPEDVANMILFLLSNQSKWITGTTIQMDGGLLLSSKK